MKFFPAIFIFCFCSQAFAQNVWSLEDCLNYVKDHNITLQKAQLSVNLSHQTMLQSKLNLLPSINGQASYYLNFGKTIDPTTNQFVTENTKTNTLSLNGNVILFSGFQKLNTIKQAQLDLSASNATLEDQTNTIELAVVNDFLNVVFGKENLQIAMQQDTLTQNELTRTQALVDAGALSESSLYSLQAQQATADLNIVNAENTLETAKLTLSQDLNLEKIIDDVVVPSLELIFKLQDLNTTIDEVYSIALANQPSIKAADYQYQSSEKGLSIARGKLYPTLNLFGQFTTNYSNLYQKVSSFDSTYVTIGKVATTNDPVVTQVGIPIFNNVPLFDQYSDNYGKAYGVTLDIPIFNGWQARSNISRSKIQVMQSELNVEEVKQNLLKSVQAAYINAVAGRKQYEATLNQVTYTQRSFDDAKVKFAAGAINSLDYITAQTNYFQAQNNFVQAKYQYVFKLKVLDFYEGKPLTIQ